MDTLKQLAQKWRTEPSVPGYHYADELESALRTEMGLVTACCGRKECGGECGNEWRGMVHPLQGGLDMLRHYFEQRADAEYTTESPSPVGNEEMGMLEILNEIESALNTSATTPTPAG